ncbi:MAG: invasion associated locus B family protein [Pseudorhodobacter sp.]|nr:invasion associated locus B family protein [Pseudorhodobacter sp.]
MAQAQDTASPDAAAPDAVVTEAPAAEAPAATVDGLSLGQEVAPADGPGTMYVAATHGDWEQRCIRTADGSDPCQLYQLLKDKNANPVAEIDIVALPDGQQAVAGATIIAPLETLLTEQILLQVDSGKGKVYPFTWCSTDGCIARVGFTAAEIAAFKKGVKATITIVPVVAPDQKVVLEVSLKGFTAGYDAVAATKGN